MQTRPRTGAVILPSGLLEPGKLYTLAQLNALGPQPRGTQAYTTDAGPVTFNGSAWEAPGAGSGSFDPTDTGLTGDPLTSTSTQDAIVELKAYIDARLS